MIDAAEDYDYPKDKPHLKRKGYEDVVINYLVSHFADENGKVKIEFVLGTHAHSDHIGGFDTVINHPDIEVKSAYLKPYKSENVFAFERIRWDNEEVYFQMLDAIKSNGVELIESFDNAETKLGEISIKFFNGNYKKQFVKFGENVNSVVTLAEVFGKRFVFAGDLNYKNGDEFKLAKEIGIVDVLITLFSIWQTFLPNPPGNDNGYGIVSFVLVYCIGGYLRLHLNNNRIFFLRLPAIYCPVV